MGTVAPLRPLLHRFDRAVDRPAFWGLAGLAAAGAATLGLTGDDDRFERFLGPVPPLVAVAGATGIGALTLRVLSRRGWCPERDRLDRPAAAALVGAATVLAGAAIAFDVAVPFEEDLNADWPASLLFYPTMAFLAEVGLHLVPLALVATAPDRLADHRQGRTGPGRRTVLAVFVAVAAIEAALQTADALAGSDRRAALFVPPHLLVIGLVELFGLRRHGFAALATFRLTYYLLWHVAWGAIRVRLLF
jgi:hypothetical protein